MKSWEELSKEIMINPRAEPFGEQTLKYVKFNMKVNEFVQNHIFA